MSCVNARSVLCLVYGVACNWISVRGFMVNGKVLWGIKFDFVPRFDNPHMSLSHIYTKIFGSR